MSKYPAEILGRPTWERKAVLEALEGAQHCPFMGQPCTKNNNVCSVQYNDLTVAICPNRFLEQHLVMENIAETYFETRHDLLLFQEVYSGDRSLGSFDYVMVKHKPMSSEITDFTIIEFQTVDTTNTGKLNQALDQFQARLDVTSENYGFGLNWANVWKRCFIQILNKGRVLESWGHKAFWVVQEPTYQYFLDSFGLNEAMQPNATGTTVFMVYDLDETETGFTLKLSRIESTTVEKLLMAFGNNPNIPTKEQFIQRLQEKFSQNLSLSLKFN